MNAMKSHLPASLTAASACLRASFRFRPPPPQHLLLRAVVLCLLCCPLALAQTSRAVRNGGGTTPAPTVQAVSLNDLIETTARRVGLDPRLLAHLVHAESAGRAGVVSPKGAGGLTQLMPATARRFGVRNIFDPVQNLDGGARYLRYLLDLFGGDVRLALAAYNSGEATVLAYRGGYALRLGDGRIINPRGERTGGIPPYRETVQYVAKIYGATYSALPPARIVLPLSTRKPAPPSLTPVSTAGNSNVAAITPPPSVQTSSTYFWK